MRRVLKWLLGFVVAILLVWVITVVIGLNEKAEVTVSKETTYFVEPLNADGTVNYVAALNARYGEGVTPANNAAVVLLAAIGPKLLDDAVRDKTAELMGVAPPRADGEYCQTLEEYFQSLPPSEWPLALSSGGELSPEQTKAIRAQFDKLAEVGGQLPPDFLVKHGLREPHGLLYEQQDKAMRGPWSIRQYPAMVGWLNANAAALNKLADLTGRSRYFIPLVSPTDPQSVVDVPAPMVVRVAELTTALLARAMLKLDSRAYDQAWEDIRLAYRLADLMGRAPRLVERLMTAGIAVGVSAAADALAGNGGLSREQAMRYLTEVSQRPPPRPLAETIDVAERCMGLDVVMSLLRVARGGKPVDLGELDAAADAPINWNDVLRRMNAYYDLTVRACTDHRSKEAQQARQVMADMADRLENKSKNVVPWAAKRIILKGIPVIGRRINTEAYGDLLMATLMMELGRLPVLEDLARMRLRLTELAFAVAAYEAETGELPEQLAQIAPKYIKQLPLDPLTRKPYVYARRGRSAVLYSLGENGRDDGGRNEPDQSGGPDDIAVRFGSGARR